MVLKASSKNIDKQYKFPQYYILLSLAFYVISLFGPAYYDRYWSPGYHGKGIELLTIGILGPLEGHYSWFANPFFFAALISRWTRRSIAIFLELISLLFALSFLLSTEMPFAGGDEASPFTATITSYEWGYYLWVLAIAVLFIGDLSLYLVRKMNTADFLPYCSVPLVIMVVSALYINNHYFGWNNPYQIEKRREKVYQEFCTLSGEHVYRKPEGKVSGIFFKCWGTNIFYKGIVNGHYSSREREGIADAKKQLLEKGLIEFYETPEHCSDDIPSKRWYLENETGEKTDALKSEYTVEFEPQEVAGHEEFLNDIEEGKILLIDNRSKTVIADTSYVANHWHKSFCGYSINGKFSTEDFLVRVLNLGPRRDFLMESPCSSVYPLPNPKQSADAEIRSITLVATLKSSSNSPENISPEEFRKTKGEWTGHGYLTKSCRTIVKGIARANDYHKRGTQSLVGSELVLGNGKHIPIPQSFINQAKAPKLIETITCKNCIIYSVTRQSKDELIVHRFTYNRLLKDTINIKLPEVDRFFTKGNWPVIWEFLPENEQLTIVLGKYTYPQTANLGGILEQRVMYKVDLPD